jgi:hypothetical protein
VFCLGQLNLQILELRGKGWALKKTFICKVKPLESLENGKGSEPRAQFWREPVFRVKRKGSKRLRKQWIRVGSQKWSLKPRMGSAQEGVACLGSMGARSTCGFHCVCH